MRQIMPRATGIRVDNGSARQHRTECFRPSLICAVIRYSELGVRYIYGQLDASLTRRKGKNKHVFLGFGEVDLDAGWGPGER